MSSLSVALLVSFAFSAALGQQQCSNGGSVCPSSAPYARQVTNRTDATYTYISTSTCPPYANPSWTNPGFACDMNAEYRIPHSPVFAKTPIPTGERIGVFNGIHYLRANPTPILGEIGVLVNGVVVFGVGAPCGGHSVCPNQGGLSRYVDAFESEGITLDQCGGHPNMQQQYHIHTGNNFTTSAGRRMCSLPEDVPGQHSALLGYMFDGFPLYGQYSQGGLTPTQLDSCQGHTHLIDGRMQYHYHLPTDFPWMIGCFKGCPVVSNNPRQLNFTDAAYGCPQGVTVDPSPLYEDAITPSTSPTPSPDSSADSADTLASFLVVILMSLLMTFIA